VADSSHTYSHWHDLADVPAKLLDELETFFVSYNAQRGIRYRPEPRAGRKAALARMRKGTVR
jgi:inorganic pyrophosphatase